MKKIIIKRKKCIGCGSCVACSEGKITFIDGKAWSLDVDYDDDFAQEIVDICPVDAICTGNEQEYKEAEKDENIDNLKVE